MALTDERRQISVVLCDLVGSTELQNRVGMERFRVVQETFLKNCVKLGEEYGGEQVRFTGDGFAFAFGRTHVTDRQLTRVADFGLALIASTKRLRPLGLTLQLRAALATDQAIVATEKQARPIEGGSLSVGGPVLNLAARLIDVAAVDQLVTDSRSASLLKPTHGVTLLGGYSFKGYEGTRQVWEIKAPSERVAVQPRTQLLLERDNELARLKMYWETALASKGTGLWVEGPAGMGKSHFAEHAVDALAPANVIRLACMEASHGNRPFQPFVDYLQRQSDTQHETLLAGLGAIGQVEKGTTPDVIRERRVNSLVGYLVQKAESTPTLVLVEDVHWLDEASAEVLLQFGGKLDQLKALLLVTSRPLQAEAAGGQVARLREALRLWPLKPLSSQASLQLVAEVLSDMPGAATLATTIASRCDGVPLYLERMAEEARLSAAEGALRVGDQAKEPVDGPSDDIPSLLFATLMATLDRDPQARRAAQLASLQGREFETMQLELVAVGLVEDVARALAQLERDGIIEPGEDNGSWRFRHHLIRDVAYYSLLDADRSEFHAAIAHALVDDPDLGQSVASGRSKHEVVAMHFESAVRYRLDPSEAVAEAQAGAREWLVAAHHAGATAEVDASLQYLARAERLLTDYCPPPEQDAKIAQLLLEACAERLFVQSLYDGFGSPEVGRCIEQADRLVAAAPSELRTSIAWQDVQQAAVGHHVTVGHIAAAGSLGERLRGDAGDLQSKGRSEVEYFGLRLASNRALSAFYCLSGRHAETLTASMDGLTGFANRSDVLDTLERRSVSSHRATVLVYRAISLLCIGRCREALATLEGAISIARDLDHGHSLAHAYVFHAAALILLRDSAMDEAADRALAFVEAHRFGTWLAPARMLVAHCHALRQDFAAGVAEIQAASAGNPDVYAALGAWLHVAVELARGTSPDSCIPVLDYALRTSEQTGERWFLPEALRVKGEILLEVGKSGGVDQRAAAIECLEQGIDLAKAQGAHLWSLRGAISLTKAKGGAVAQSILAPLLVQFDTSERFADLELARTLI